MTYWRHDERIDENTPLRDLEKKVHYLMHMCANAGIAIDWRNEQFTCPDDMSSRDIWLDAAEVQAKCNKD